MELIKQIYQKYFSKPFLGNLSFNKITNKNEYQNCGFTTSKFLNENDIDKVKDVFKKYIQLKENFDVYDSMAHETPETIQNIQNDITKIIKPILNNYIENYKIVCSVFFVKNHTQNTKVRMHIDPSFTSAQYNQIGVWIPLIDSNEQTGTFKLLNNSHKLLSGFYNPKIPAPFLKIEKELEPLFSEVNLKKGEALFFNNQILHYTSPNLSSKIRIALIVKLIDKNAPLVTAHFSNNKIIAYKNYENVFLNGKYKNNVIPDSSVLMKNIQFKPKVFEIKDLKRIKKVCSHV